MVKADVDVKHAGVELEELEDCKHDIVDIAKPEASPFFAW